MTRNFLLQIVVLAATVLFVASAPAQERTSAITSADLEAAYTAAIQKRTADILTALALNDAARSNRVTDVILRQYRALKARDEVIVTATSDDETAGSQATRASLYQCISGPLHDQFLAKLSAQLTPDQVETVKDKMTYNKVKVTYDAYCAILPGLTYANKAKILEWLKEAREQAMDGGSANEKSRVFQVYKDKINDYLNAQGHDTAKAFAEWTAKQNLASKQTEEIAPKPTPPTQ
jgi:BarA-like signal transduction histidine kinase